MAKSKKETTLSKQIINDLKHDCSKNKELIKLVKIAGSMYQEKMVDYIGCYKSKFIAIEFKVEGNREEPKQATFLEEIARCNGIALTISFLLNGNICVFKRSILDNEIKISLLGIGKIINLYSLINEYYTFPSIHPTVLLDSQHRFEIVKH